jgi:predicted secreted hydrolase
MKHGDHREDTEATETAMHVSRAMFAIRSITTCFLRALCACSVVSVFPLWAFDPVVPGRALEFPRDYGAHPGHRIEWWYVTGHLESDGKPMGFQVTFFRVRNPDAESNPSRFAPKQLLFAHAALADPAVGKLLHGQKSARLLEGLVEASTTDTALRIDDWTLARAGGAYRTRVGTGEFTLELVMKPTQPVLLQGAGGFSRKGPSQAHASYYYSEPHLAVSGHVVARGSRREVKGVAWLDHEWSSELLVGEASGWDWLGANLEGGESLMAFRIRGKDGATLWSNATVRANPAAASAPSRELKASFRPLRHWTSPRTGVRYPVAMEVAVGERTWRVEPLMDDQELDARASTGTLYWEGAVKVDGAPRGMGYLELTGYAERVPF